MPCTGGPQAARQRFPLAARPQHLDHGGHRVPVIQSGPAIFLPDFGRGEYTHHRRPPRIRDLIVGAHPKGVLTQLGSLLSGHGGTKYTVFITFRIGT
jgi:hypothetical protein